MRQVTKAAVRDSAGVLWNIGEINPGTHRTLPQYVAVTLPFTIMTAWIIITFQNKYLMPGTTFFQHWDGLLPLCIPCY